MFGNDACMSRVVDHVVILGGIFLVVIQFLRPVAVANVTPVFAADRQIAVVPAGYYRSFPSCRRVIDQWPQRFAFQSFGGLQIAQIDKRWINVQQADRFGACLLYTSPSPRDRTRSRMPSSA